MAIREKAIHADSNAIVSDTKSKSYLDQCGERSKVFSFHGLESGVEGLVENFSSLI